MPNEAGRVLTGGAPGVYLTGWIERGPRGVIGTDRACAAETVTALLDDYAGDRLQAPRYGQSDLENLLATHPGGFGLEAWSAIDAVEREAGRSAGRLRVKVTNSTQLANIASRTASAKAVG